MPSIWPWGGLGVALGGFGRLDTPGSRSSKTRTFRARFFVRAQESPRKLALPVANNRFGLWNSGSPGGTPHAPNVTTADGRPSSRCSRTNRLAFRSEEHSLG